MSKGSLQKRGKKSWRLKFDRSRDPITGERRVYYSTFHGTKREAEIELARLIAKEADGHLVEPSKVTVGEFLDQWIDNAEALSLSPKTVERYRQLIGQQMKPHLGSISLQKLKPAHIATWHATLLREGGKNNRPLSARTVGHAHRVLHRALVDAVRLETIERNPASVIPPPKVEAEEMEILTQAEVADVLERLQGTALYALVVTAIYTGMRRGELLALRWSDVDLEIGMLRVERSLEQTNAAGLRFKAPKTKAGRRKISLSGYAVGVLRKHHKARLEMQMKLGAGRLPDDALVFCNPDGSPYSPRAVSKSWKRMVKAHNLPTVTMHSLRHSHASALISAGMDAVTVCRRLGHANPSITLSTYSHLFTNSDDRAAEILDALLPTPKAE